MLQDKLYRPRILAIDDVPMNLLTLGAALKPDYDIQVATSGPEGLTLAQAQRPDLVLLDIMMPGMDGFETLRALRELPGLASVPVIFITALSDATSEEQGLALGALDFITKPIEVKTARQRIHNLLEREALRREVVRQRDQLVLEVAQRKAAQERLQLAASVFASAREGITITDLNGVIEDVNDAFTLITGYRHDEAVGQTMRLVKSGRQSADFYQALWAALNGKGHWYGQLWNRRKNGELFPALMNINTVLDSAGEPKNFVALFSDITALKEREAELDRIAHFDILTGLPNRALLADRLRQAMSQVARRGQHLAVVFLDLDGFKAVNDRYGHEVGDQLLVEVSARMTQALREGDTLARLGGDEFVAVLVDLDGLGASGSLFQRLLDAAAQPVTLGQTTVQVSASLGVTYYPQDDEVDAEQLLRQSDQAMYQAKTAGKNRYQVFDQACAGAPISGHELATQLQTAIRQNELVLHYQPKLNLQDGTVTGVEALLRWNHPDRGLLLPGQFLAAADTIPLQLALHDWVFDAVLRQMADWDGHGWHGPVSLNVDARAVQHPDFVGRLQLALARYPSVNPARLELELMESSALKELSRLAVVMNQCRALGLSFALDDFGTGQATLKYLQALPVGTLKMDRSVVQRMLESPADRRVTEAIVHLASVFGHALVASGVETPQQRKALMDLGCDVAQGYGLAHPMPEAELTQWLQRQTKTAEAEAAHSG